MVQIAFRKMPQILEISTVPVRAWKSASKTWSQVSHRGVRIALSLVGAAIQASQLMATPPLFHHKQHSGQGLDHGRAPLILLKSLSLAARCTFRQVCA